MVIISGVPIFRIFTVESFCHYHTKFWTDSLINKEIIPISKKGHIFFETPCKMEIDLWHCLGRVKHSIIAKFHRTDLVICSHSSEGKISSYS